MRATGEGLVGEERAVLEVNVFPAGVEDFGLTGPGEEHQMDGIGRSAMGKIPEHVEKADHFEGVQQDRSSRRLCGKIGRGEVTAVG